VIGVVDLRAAARIPDIELHRSAFKQNRCARRERPSQLVERGHRCVSTGNAKRDRGLEPRALRDADWGER